MNYRKQINELKTTRDSGELLNVQLIVIDEQIHKIKVNRAGLILKIVVIAFIIGVTLLSM